MTNGEWYRPDRVEREGEFNEARSLFARWRADRLGRLANRVEPPTRDLAELTVRSGAADLEATGNMGPISLTDLLDGLGLSLTGMMVDPFADIRCIWPGCKSILTSVDKHGVCRRHSMEEL